MQLFGSKSKCKKISRPFGIVLDIMPFIVAKIPVEEGSIFRAFWGLSQGGRKALAGEIAHRLCDFAGDHLGNKDQLRVLRSSWHALT